MSDTGYGNDTTLAPGAKLLGRYDVKQKIGSGGMATVYLAEDLANNNQEVAVKVLDGELAADQSYIKRFIREVELMNTVNHPNVVRTYDLQCDNDLYFFTMEYVRGVSLSKLLSDGRFKTSYIKEFIIQICKGLEAIHKAEIIHRDLKPGNILVLSDGSLKITDFGVARPKTSDLTKKNQRVGSTAYMAPEVWLGKKLTPAVDYYALGVLLYEVVTGQTPYGNEEPSKLMKMHLQSIVKPPRSINEKVPKWLNSLIIRLLGKNPKERPQSLQEVVSIIENRPSSSPSEASRARAQQAALPPQKLPLSYRIMEVLPKIVLGIVGILALVLFVLLLTF